VAYVWECGLCVCVCMGVEKRAQESKPQVAYTCEYGLCLSSSVCMGVEARSRVQVPGGIYIYIYIV